MNKKEIKVIDELTKINIELKQKNKKQKEVLDKIKEDIEFVLVSIKQEKEMSTDSRTKQEMKTVYNILNKLLEEIE